MRAIDRKVLRDFWQMRGAALAIAFVLAAGVATFVMFLTTLDSLELSLASFYRTYRFGDVFVSLQRAPNSLRQRITEIPGVSAVDTRVVTFATVDIPGFNEPVSALITSIPDEGEPTLNNLYIHSGRRVTAGRDNEVVVSRAFAAANHFNLGDKLAVTIRGKRKELIIVGTAVSPDYTHQLRPGGVFPDYKRFSVFWMARTPLASANHMEGAFNSVAVTLVRGAPLEEVIDRIDLLLAPYGGTGAIGREHQQSHRFLAQEFRTLRSLVGIFPVIFMGVAAFLLNVVVNRLVGMQREQVATLKAFGYSNRDVALHYFKLVMVIVAIGTAIGLLAGTAFGYWFSNIYKSLFELPYLTFRVHGAIIASSFVISTVAALSGTFFAVRNAARLRPADAMRPESPAIYRTSLIERSGLQRLMGQPTRMIVRHLSHHPGKTFLSIIGIAFAIGILMTGRFERDSVSHTIFLQFDLAQRQDLSLTFSDPTSRRALYDLTGLPGVEYGEVFRASPIRLRHEHRSFRTSVLGLEPGSQLQRVFNEYTLRRVTLPPDGIILTSYLADRLGVHEGDTLTVEFLEGRRGVRQMKVALLVPKLIGIFTYMDMATLNREMQEGSAISGVNLAIDEAFADEIYKRVKETPRVVGIAIRKHEIENFHETMDKTMLFFTFIATLFASVIAFGIVYNSARITLAERSRELASLRVLGFTRAEISYVLLGELAIFVVAAIPIGLAIGYGLCWYIAKAVENELYRVPLVINPATYAFSVTVVLLAAAISALVVRRRLDQLDLIGVLKTRE